MNDIKAEKLKKRTFIDLVFTAAVCAVMFVCGIAYLVKYLQGSITEYLLNGMYALALFAVTLLLCLILADIRKNGKPFSRPVTHKLRLMSLITMLCGMIPSWTTIETGDNNIVSVTTFDTQNMVILALGIALAIISEIFVYGCQLQEDNDLIA